jgi:hypothetical protein
MLDMTRRGFIALVGGAGLVLAAKVRLARAQQPAPPKKQALFQEECIPPLWNLLARQILVYRC